MEYTLIIESSEPGEKTLQLRKRIDEDTARRIVQMTIGFPAYAKETNRKEAGE